MQNNNLETALSQIKPSLTQMEREMLQSRVRERVVASMMGSVNTKTFTLQNYMVPLIALAVLLFGTGSAALASDAARPGDILFPVDTAMENLSLALSNDSRKAELRVLLADERFKEFSQLVEEALKNSPSATTTQATSSATTTATSTTATSSVATSSITEIEADVFTDVTIIKLKFQIRR
jgi:predicted RNA methylase